MSQDLIKPGVVSEGSFAFFVYPFTFPVVRDGAFKAVVDTVEGAEIDGISVWEPFELSTEDLMPHVANYLKPHEGGNPDSLETLPGARIWNLNSSHAAVYGLGDTADWLLTAEQEKPNGRVNVPFRLGSTINGEISAILMLFDVGVGLLTLRAEPKANDIDSWFDFLHYFRNGARESPVRLSATIETEGKTVAFFPNAALKQPLIPDETNTLRGLVTAILDFPGNKTPKRLWWRDVFVKGRVLPFCGLYVDGVPKEHYAKQKYRLRNFFKSGQEVHPAASDLSDDHTSILPFAENEWFIFSIEGGSFLAYDAPQDAFFRERMPKRLQKEYFLGFLIALHQRFALIDMSEQVARNWPHDDLSSQSRRLETFEIIRNKFLTFTARGYFAQVMQRDSYHACYQRWQEIFQLGRLYNEVREEVREMHGHLSAEREQKAQKSLNDLMLLIGSVSAAAAVPALTFGFLGIDVRGYRPTHHELVHYARTAFEISAAIIILVQIWKRLKEALPTRHKLPRED